VEKKCGQRQKLDKLQKEKKKKKAGQWVFGDKN